MTSLSQEADVNPFEPPATSAGSNMPAPGEASLRTAEFDRLAALLMQTRPWVRLTSVLIFLSCAPLGFLMVLEIARGIIGLKTPIDQAQTFGNAIAHGMMLAMMFFPALYLWRYASRISDFFFSRRLAELEEALDAQRKYWKLLGIMTCIFIVLMALFVVLLVLGATMH